MAFRRVLVANRGEIAVRVIRTLHMLGMEAVAVFSDADMESPHVEAADLAVPLGGMTPQESYLQIERILEAAKRAGAEAVHPGYGFLSENPDFARAVEEAGLVFIGPTPEAMERMGDKTRAHVLAREVGVPTPPGGILVRSPEEAREAAEKLGYPVVIKAAGGGGGKGMRKIRSPQDLEHQVESAIREAQSAFGDPRVFVEKWIEPARHVEVQVLADHHGNVWILGERECSLQRRYQKIVEETPSPGITEKTRQGLFQAARRLVEASGYTSAGTLEFLVDGEGNYYFMEMNTRLQVEHPVTEMVWGLDLVAWQIRIAQGEKLPPLERTPRGHAIEARIYAEDPYAGFLPSTGEILTLHLPHHPGVRVDHAFREGMVVHAFYDPMLAKVIAWGETREGARARLVGALKETVILGVMHNIGFLVDLLESEWFRKGETFTTTVESLDLRPPEPPPEVLAALLLVSPGQSPRLEAPAMGDPYSPFRTLGRFRIGEES